MPALHRIAADGGAGDGAKGGGNALHARFGLLRPGHARLRLHVDGRHKGAARQQDADRCQAEQVVGVAAQVHLGRGVDADAPDHEKPRWVLADVLQDLLEGLAVEERGLDLDSLIARYGLGHPQVGLIDLGEAGVDDLFVQLFLLFEPEDFRCFGREHVDDAVEHRVVEVGVVDGDGFDLLLKNTRQVDRGPQPGEGLGAAVDGDHDPVGGLVAKWMDVPHHEGVDADAADHAVGNASDHAVLDCAHAERPQHDQVVVGCGDVVDQAFPILAVERFVLEGQAGPIAGGLHDVEVGIGDELQAARDQGVVDLALALELLLVLVLLRQRVLHLFEAHVVHPGGVDVAAHQGRFRGTSQPDRHLDGGVGVVRVIKGDVDLPVHRRLPPIQRRDALT